MKGGQDWVRAPTPTVLKALPCPGELQVLAAWDQMGKTSGSLWGPAGRILELPTEQRREWGLTGRSHFWHKEESQGLPKQRQDLLPLGERCSRNAQPGLLGLPEGKEEVWIVPWERESIDPSPGPALEPRYTALWSRKQTEGVCCHFSRTCPGGAPLFLPQLQGFEKAPSSESSGTHIIGTISHNAVQRPGTCAAATTDTGGQMKEFSFLLRLWASGRICIGPTVLGPWVWGYSGATPSMVFLPPKTFHGYHNIQVTSGHLIPLYAAPRN